MERALNLPDLVEALGVHQTDVLPSPQELASLIADVEIRAFRGDFAVDENLERAAWYLHAVASASEAAELYTPARQRRAFAVSAHVFDLTLADPRHDARQRLNLAFGAQVGYRRADLDPNATAVYRRVSNLLIHNTPLVDHADTLAVEAGVAFLGLDTSFLFPLLRSWRRQLNELAATVELDDLQTTMFGPGQQIVRAVWSLLRFLAFGTSRQLSVARAALVSVLDGTAGTGDLDARWVAAHLSSITDGLETGSLYSILPPGTPNAVAQAFCLADPPVLTLWPPQRELLERPGMNPLDSATRRLLLSVPTSAGKTLLAQLIICTHIATQSGGVCYVTPLRSLGREMRRALSGRLRVLNRELSDDSDLFDILSFSHDPTDVEVTTPERLMHLLRHDADAVMQRFSLFVIDEAHLLAQPGRGFTVEGLLAYLMATDESPRIVLLSGGLGNAASLASWLDAEHPEVLFTSDWRGPRRLHALLNTQPVWEAAVRSPRKSARWPIRVTVPQVAQLRLRPAEAGPVTRLTTRPEEPLGNLVLKEDPSGKLTKDSGGTPGYKIFAATASILTHAGSLLMIVSSRTMARDAAKALAGYLPPREPTSELVEFLRERLGDQHPLISCAEHGVAYHHAGLPVDVLDAIEEAVRTEIVLAIVSTSTLTDGVNLPVRTVVIAETRFEGQHPGAQLGAARLMNAIGRAGRAGRESEGWIVLALQKQSELKDFDELRPNDEALEARSTLLAEESLAALADAEELIATTADAIFRLTPDTVASDFVSYTWFVLTTLQPLWTPFDDPIQMDVVLGKLLAFQQMDPVLRQRWMRLAEQVRATYERASPAQRRRWTAAGTSLGTAARLDAITGQVVDAVATRERELRQLGFAIPDDAWYWPLNDTILLLSQQEVLTRLLAQPEADNCWKFWSTRAKGDKNLIDVSIADRLTGWVNGLDVPALAERLLPGLAVEWQLEQTVDAISSTFEHYLAWTVGVLVEQANARLEEAGLVSRLRPDTAWCIRHGVNTPHALALLNEGVRSRRLAHVIGSEAQRQGVEIEDVRSWLTGMHIRGWRRKFDAVAREVLDLLQFIRARRNNVLRSLLETGRAQVTLRGDLEIAYQTPEIVYISTTTDAPSELQIVSDSGPAVAVVDVDLHADVDAVLASGLDIVITLQGRDLSFMAPEIVASD
ncbi:DEAD/DEAH box helicase [Pseudonocardia sp. TRM90224]|uniref:DEAD/DEAH box helicase n=1 Tax=Pseudonocardia sp. TRM90224 TaxID=2812678 RepID=UPI001E3DF197|nr:DEAD/DEAH box helicase [Pseudonocardia sp. TRM90224]